MKGVNIPYYRALSVELIPSTIYLENVVRITDEYELARVNYLNPTKNKPIFLDLPLSDHIEDFLELALEYLLKNGWNVVGTGQTEKGYIILCDNFGDKYINLF